MPPMLSGVQLSTWKVAYARRWRISAFRGCALALFFSLVNDLLTNRTVAYIGRCFVHTVPVYQTPCGRG